MKKYLIVGFCFAIIAMVFIYRLIGMDINWTPVFSGLIAFGTVGAVVVSLWLSSKSNPKLRVSATKRFLMSFNGNSKDYPEFLVLEVTNVGGSPINVLQFIWRTGCYGKQYAIQMPDDNPYALSYSTKFPKILHPGEQACCFLRYNGFFEKDDTSLLFSFKMNSKLEKILPLWLRKHFWKIGVDTTIGQKNYWATVSKALQQDIIQVLNKKTDVGL